MKTVIGPTEAGFHWKLPWPIDRVHRFDARLRSFETEFRQIGTQDQKTVILTAYAEWRVKDARRFLETVGREDAAAKKIRDLLENQVSVVLRMHPLNQLVNTDRAQMKFTEIENAFLTGIQAQADANYGIQVVSVGIKRLGLPESVTKEVFNRMKEDRQKEIKELTAEGESTAKQIKSDAEEKAKRIMARAEAFAKTVEGQGDAQGGDVLRSLRQESAAQRLPEEAGDGTEDLRGRPDHPGPGRGQDRSVRSDPGCDQTPRKRLGLRGEERFIDGSGQEAGRRRREEITNMGGAAMHDHVMSDSPRGAEYEEALDPANQSLAEALRKSFRILKLLMLVLVVLYFLSGWFSVKPGDVGVILRFGRILGTGPGELADSARAEAGLALVLALSVRAMGDDRRQRTRYPHRVPVPVERRGADRRHQGLQIQQPEPGPR